MSWCCTCLWWSDATSNIPIEIIFRDNVLRECTRQHHCGYGWDMRIPWENKSISRWTSRHNGRVNSTCTTANKEPCFQCSKKSCCLFLCFENGTFWLKQIVKLRQIMKKRFCTNELNQRWKLAAFSSAEAFKALTRGGSSLELAAALGTQEISVKGTPLYPTELV